MALIILPPGSDSAVLQSAVDTAVFGDIIQLSGDMPFINTVSIRQGLEITIQSEAGSNWVMYQFTPNIRHFIIDGSLILENITVDGMKTGGGVQLNRGAFCLQHGAAIQNCHAENGGGVLVVAGVFSIYDGDYGKPFPLKGGEVRDNTAVNGGGIYFTSGMLNISASTGYINGNKAENGGGIYVAGGTFSLSGGDIFSNEAGEGGGLYIKAGSLSMSRGIFDANTATNHGGGIYASSTAALNITGSASVISNNKAVNGNGGGIFTEDPSYLNLATESVAFRCNTAKAAYAPPAGAEILYPGIKFSETTITEHVLNNYDISRSNGAPIMVTSRITYDSNGGTGNYIGPDIGPCETDTVSTIEATGISYANHNFTGWNTMANGKGITYKPGDEISLGENITLYAQWTPIIVPCYCDCYELSREICREIYCRLHCDPCCRDNYACFSKEFSKEFCRCFCKAYNHETD